MSNGPIAAIELQQSEAAVLAVASRFFAAYISSGRVDEESEDETMERCIMTALRMALRVDRLLQSDDEHTGLGLRSPV